MATIKSMITLLEGVPKDTTAVLVLQRGKVRHVLGTDDVISGHEVNLKNPTWPQAVWDGIAIALMMKKDPEEVEDASPAPH